MFEIQTQGNNGRKPLATLGNLKLACVELGISDDKHTLRRASRAFDLYHSGKVEHLSRKAFALSGESHRVDHTFAVKSQYRERLPYQVHISKSGTSYCTCPDWRNYSGDLVLPDVHFHCKHSIAARIWLHHNGNGSKRGAIDDAVLSQSETFREASMEHTGEAFGEPCDSTSALITSESGTKRAKELQDKLNGNNGTGGESHPSTRCDATAYGRTPSAPDYQLDQSNPFEECEARDIDQINGNGWRVRRDDKPSRHALGDLVHHLSNGEYVISYNGIMALAEQHDVTFLRHTVKSDAKSNGTVIAHARLGTCTRASGKPMNGSFTTAVELAKRNAARQLLPLVEIKALEKKAQLEAEFDWEKAKAKCLKIVPDFKLDILIHDLVKAGTLRQAHPSDYSRREWLLIFDSVKKDAETNGSDDNDNGGGDNPSPNNEREAKFTECRYAAKDFVRFNWLKDDMLKEGILSGDWTDDDFDKLKEACEIDASLFRKELGYWTIDIQPNRGKWAYRRRYQFWLTPMSRRCFWCGNTEGVMPDTFIHWGRYEIKTSLCLECSQKVGNGELDKDRIVQKFDEVYRAYGGVGSSTAISPDDVPSTEAEFIAKCKESEAEVEDTTVDDDTPTNGDGKRKLQIDKKRNIVLIEPDGTQKPMTFKEVSLTFGGDVIMRLTQGIQLCGADISTVELDD